MKEHTQEQLRQADEWEERYGKRLDEQCGGRNIPYAACSMRDAYLAGFDSRDTECEDARAERDRLREALAAYVEAFPVALLTGPAEDGFPSMVCCCCGDDPMDEDMLEDTSGHADDCILIRARALLANTDPKTEEK